VQQPLPPLPPPPPPAPRDVAPEGATAEPPRRRSTIREPAPMFSSGAMSDVQPPPAAAAASEPPVSAPEPAAAEAPAEQKTRLFGWWNKRG